MKRHISYIVLLFFISRIIFWLVFDIKFNSELLYSGWQFLDVELLKDDLLNSIYFLHSQAPLPNFVTGIFLKTFNDIREPIHWLFMLMNLTSIILFYLSGCELKINNKYFFWISIYLIFHPQFVLYENYYFYSVPVMFFITLSCYLIIKYFNTNNTKYLILFFISILILTLTRSMFHIIFVIAITSILFLINNYKKQILVFGFSTLILTSSWYLKNYNEFGFFGASSWLGMNISRIMLDTNSQDDYLKKGPFRPLDEYQKISGSTFTLNKFGEGHSTLIELSKSNGSPNYNNFNYLLISNDFKNASIEYLRSNPSYYFSNVLKGSLYYFKPTIHYPKLSPNYEKLKIYSSIYIFDIPSIFELLGFELNKRNFGLLSIIFSLPFHLIIFYLTINYLLNINWNNISNKDKSILVIISFIGFVLIIGNLFEIAENNRFRYTTSVIFFLLASFVISNRLKN